MVLSYDVGCIHLACNVSRLRTAVEQSGDRGKLGITSSLLLLMLACMCVYLPIILIAVVVSGVVRLYSIGLAY
jgi:hypothetical protein